MNGILRIAVISLLPLSYLAISASGESIYSVTNGSTGASQLLCLGQACFSQELMVSWTTSVFFSNVSIFAEVGGDNTSTSLTAALTNQVGAGTTIANQVASVTFTPSNVDSPGLLLFSGLNLGPGTYDLVLSSSAKGPSLSYWYAYNIATVSTALGVAVGNTGSANTFDSSSSPNATYAPASLFDDGNPLGLSIQITGTQGSAPAPEPGPGIELTLGLGLMGGGMFLRRRRWLTRLSARQDRVLIGGRGGRTGIRTPSRSEGATRSSRAAALLCGITRWRCRTRAVQE